METIKIYPISGDKAIYYNESSNWSTVRGAGTASDTRSGTEAHIQTFKQPNAYYLERYFVNFDTSVLSEFDNVISAKIYVFCYELYQADATTKMAITGSTANNTIGTRDFNKFNDTLMSDVINLNSFSTGSYNAFTLTSSGISNISLDGKSKFSIRNYNNDISNSAPGTTQRVLRIKNSSNSGTTKDPYLEVVVEKSTTNTSNFFQLF